MKITKITIHDYLKLKDVELNPSTTNIICGKNKQGKTSILKAINEAFMGGGNATCIREGGDKSEITIEMDDLNIKRTITEKGNYLDISNAQGMKMPKPQKYLDGILGTFSFNPIEFFDKKSVDRKRYLLDAVKLTITPEELAVYTGGQLLNGIDFTAHALEVVEQARKFFYELRTVANAEQTKDEKTVLSLSSSLPDIKEIDKELEVKVKAESEKLTLARLDNLKVENLRKDIADYDSRVAQLLVDIQRLKELRASKLSELEKTPIVEIGTMEATIKEMLERLNTQRETEFALRNLEAIRGKLKETSLKAESLDKIVKALTKDAPADLIKKANLPIAGLSIDGETITINGIALDNLSSSEQLKLGLQIVRALNGTFHVVCIDGIEMLDSESFEFFLKEIEDDGFQYFVTRVTPEASPNSIVIDNGSIKK